jgi:hypothetical protein
MKYLNILSALLTLVLVSSCNQGASTSVNGDTGAGVWMVPAVGTRYVYESQGINSPVFDTVTILATDQHLGGKTGVIGCADHSGGVGTFFYNIEQNGDISYGDSSHSSPSVYTWTTFPTASQKPIGDPVTDTTEGSIHIFKSDVRSFVGTETLTTLAGSFSALHVRETSISIITGPDSLNCNASDTAITDTWFAPSTGLYVKVVDSGTEDGQAFNQSEVDLIKYLPK